MSAFPPVGELLPHGPEMLLLDRVIDAGEGRIVCGLTLRADSTFVSEGRAPCVIALEYMAQAVAAHLGLRAYRRRHTTHSGLLIGAREVRFAVDELRVGDALEVYVEVLVEDEIRGSFECRVLREGAQIAAATLSVYRGPASRGEPSS